MTSQHHPTESEIMTQERLETIPIMDGPDEGPHSWSIPRLTEDEADEIMRRAKEYPKLEAEAAAMREALESVMNESPHEYMPKITGGLQSTAGKALLDELSALRKVAEAAQVVSDLNLAASGAQWMELDVAMEVARKK